MKFDLWFQLAFVFNSISDFIKVSQWTPFRFEIQIFYLVAYALVLACTLWQEAFFVAKAI